MLKRIILFYQLTRICNLQWPKLKSHAQVSESLIVDNTSRTNALHPADEFRVYSLSVNKTSDINRDHVLEGLLGYFSRLLGMQLLYKFERPQYADTMEEHRGFSHNLLWYFYSYVSEEVLYC